MPPWNGGNHSRSDQHAVTWMGCTGVSVSHLMKSYELDWHDQYDTYGPSCEEIWDAIRPHTAYKRNLYKQVKQDMKRMLYTKDGEGCLLLERNDRGRTTFKNPGPNSLPYGPAEKDLLAAVEAKQAAYANRFYPDQPIKIMTAAMKCSPQFPFEKVKAQGTKMPGLETIALDKDLFSMVLDHLPHTSRAILAQVSPTMAFGVSECHTLWTVNDMNMQDADFTAEEFKEVAKAGQAWGVDSPRGATNLTIAMGTGDYDPRTSKRSRGDYQIIAVGVLRMFRAVHNWGHTIRQLCLKHIPFIDHKAAASIIEACPKLEKFEYIGCGMTTYFDIVKLLGHIEQVQASRGTHIHFDPAPAFYKGPKWADRKSPNATYDRKGCFGVTKSEPGVDLPVAILKLIVYELAPAAKAAGQLHMLYDLTSMCRQSLEALPTCTKAIPMMIAVWEIKESIEENIAAAKVKWDEQHPDNTFTRRVWPKELTKTVLELECLKNWTAVRACFGKWGYKQTADRGFYSCNFMCRKGTYKDFVTQMICDGADGCGMRLPRYFFNSNLECEGCRLKLRIAEENDNLEIPLRKATKALGFGDSNSPYVSNKASAFPFDPLVQTTITSRGDLIRHLISIPEFAAFIKRAESLDAAETQAGFLRGRISARQVDHPCAGTPPLESHGVLLYKWYAYRRTLTHEDLWSNGCRGWTPTLGNAYNRW